jgi:hypothetical protein
MFTTLYSGGEEREVSVPSMESANPLEGAPNGLATRVSMPGRVRSSLRWARDRNATVSHRGLTLTPVTLSEYAGRS